MERVSSQEAHKRLLALGYDVLLLDEIEEWELSETDINLDFEVKHGDGVIIVGNVVGDNFYVGENAHAVVIGNVVCDSAGVFGELTVHGDFSAGSYIVARSFNDYGMEVNGTVTTKLYIEDGTATFAERFACTVWRTTNVVVEGILDRRTLGFTPVEQRSRSSARSVGLSDGEIADLAMWFDFP